MVRPTSSGMGFWAGVVAASTALALLYAIRNLSGAPTLTDLLADRFTAIVPLSVFALLLAWLENAAKHLLNLTLILGQVIAGGVGGALFFRLALAGPALWLAGFVLALGLWLVLGIALLPLAGAGPFGTAAPAGAGPIMSALLVATLAYGLGLGGLAAWLRAGSSAQLGPADHRGRRQVVQGLGAAFVLLGVGAIAWRFASRMTARAIATVKGMPAEITSNDDFYTVSKNFLDPVVEAKSWRLEVKGVVSQPYRLTYDEFRALESVEQMTTLECISNEIGGDLISNAVWRGVRLSDLIARAAPQPGVRKVVFKCADGYEDSIALGKALEPTTIVAHEMNGVPLPPAHGFPARVVVPGIYGMKNAKWVTEIRLLDYDFKGYWQERGWSDEAVIQTMSRIDVPGPKRLPREPLTAGGIAFAGDRGVGRVEVSFDRGRTWHEAAIKTLPGKAAWTLWTREWEPPSADHHLLIVRATDGLGQVQPETPADPLPDGAQGYHSLVVSIVEPEPGQRSG